VDLREQIHKRAGSLSGELVVLIGVPHDCMPSGREMVRCRGDLSRVDVERAIIDAHLSILSTLIAACRETDVPWAAGRSWPARAQRGPPPCPRPAAKLRLRFLRHRGIVSRKEWPTWKP
jgi:hypothetical protein